MLELKDVSKEWKEFKLVDINLKVNREEYFIVLGPSGAGKTLLLETIAGIHRPDRGKVYLENTDITDLPPEKREIAYVPQNYALFPHLTTYDNIAFGLKLRGASKSEIERKVKELAEILGISKLLHRKPKTLSGGEQQRVALARALVIEPKLLLLDEPFSNVDVKTRSKLFREMRKWRDELKFTAIHVTHNLEEALVLGKRGCVLIEGKIAEIGELSDVLGSPKNVDVAKFLGYNVIEGKRVFGVEFPKKSFIIIKPENLILSKKDGLYSGQIEIVENLGAISRVYLNVDGITLQALLPTSKIISEKIREGDEVFVTIKDYTVV